MHYALYMSAQIKDGCGTGRGCGTQDSCGTEYRCRTDEGGWVRAHGPGVADALVANPKIVAEPKTVDIRIMYLNDNMGVFILLPQNIVNSGNSDFCFYIKSSLRKTKHIIWDFVIFIKNYVVKIIYPKTNIFSDVKH